MSDIQNKKTSIQEYLIIIMSASFVLAVIINAPRLWGDGTMTAFNAVCTYSYLVLWVVTVLFCRKSKSKLLFILFFRWLFFILWLLAFIFNNGFSLPVMVIKVLFGIMVSVYGGLPKGIFNSILFMGFVPVIQTVAASFLFLRLIKKGKNKN